MVNPSATSTADAYHFLFYHQAMWETITWFGHKLRKWPGDIIVYQEIIFATRPTVIIEGGTSAGGSALFFAHMLDLLYPRQDGPVVHTFDIERPAGLPEHPRIQYHTMSMLDPQASEICAKDLEGARV